MFVERRLTSVHRGWIWGITLLVICLILYTLKGILLPFVAGILIAYLLNPLVEKMCAHRLSRSTAAALSILFAFMIIIGFFLFTLPFLQSQFIALARHFPIYGERIYHKLQPLITDVGEFVHIPDLEQLKDRASAYIGDLFQWSLGAIGGILGNTLALANILSLLILTPVVAFYLLRDWPHFIQTLNTLLPRAQAPTIRMQAVKINQTLGHYLRGQSLVCLCLALFYSLGLKMVGLQYCWTIGVATGILAFIPYVGFMIGALSGIGLAMAQFTDWSSVGWTMAVFLSGQSLEAYVLTPKLVGERIGLHPVWIIFALLTGGLLFGFLGMFMAMPVAATLGVIIRFLIQKYLQSEFYRGRAERIR